MSNPYAVPSDVLKIIEKAKGQKAPSKSPDEIAGDIAKAAARIVRARVGLLFDSPFFGTLALRLKLEPTTKHPTMGVDMKRLIFNPNFVEELNDAELLGVVAHEVMHCVFEHPLRRKDRRNDIWQQAIDYVVNDVVVQAGFILPAGRLLDAQFTGWNVDTVYDHLIKEAESKESEPDKGEPEEGDGEGGEGQGEGQATPSKEKEGEGKGKSKGKPEKSDKGGDKRKEADKPEDADEEEHEGMDGGEAQQDTPEEPDPDLDPARCGGTLDAEDEQGEGLNDSESKKLASEWKVATAQAAMAAKSAGQMPGALRRVVEEIINPKVDWKELLRRFLDQFAKDDYTWKSPNRRHIANGDYLPSLRSETMKEIIVAVDTSASISGDLIKAALAEIEGISAGAALAPIRVLYCDYVMQGEEEFGPYDRPIKLKRNFPGGGGTSFVPVFDYVAKKNLDPSLMVYITDLQCSAFPKVVPEYPVLWLQTTEGWGHPKFGDIIKAF